MITVDCACGARFRANDESAGHSARCAKCGQKLRIPGPPKFVSAAVSSPDAKRAAVAASPGKDDRITVRCGCGAKMSAPRASAGKKARCRACGAILTIAAPAAPPPAAAASDDHAFLYGFAEAEQSAAAIKSPQRPACSQCGATMSPDDLMCPACGCINAAADGPGAAAAATGAEPRGAGGGVTCPSCRRTLPGNSKICIACGINVATGRAILTAQDNIDQIYHGAETWLSGISLFIPFGLYPVGSEAFGTHKPWAVRAIAAITIAVSLWFLVLNWTDSPQMASAKNLMMWCGQKGSLEQYRAEIMNRLPKSLRDDPDVAEQVDEVAQTQLDETGEFHAYQLVTNALLHGGILHLAGNLLFLFVLGSCVNSLIGNLQTAILYPLLAIAASVAQMISSAHELRHAALGASGAVMGLAGMYLVLFPVHRVHMAAWLRIVLFLPPIFYRGKLHLKLFSLRGFWVVLFYIAFDVFATIVGSKDHIAHWAHLGGFIAGILVGLVLLVARLINARGGDILSVMLGQRAWGLIGKPRIA